MAGNAQRADRIQLGPKHVTAAIVMHEGEISQTLSVFPENLSDTGIAFHIDKRLVVGTHCRVVLSNNTMQILAIGGVVTRCVPDASENFTCALVLDEVIDAKVLLGAGAT